MAAKDDPIKTPKPIKIVSQEDKRSLEAVVKLLEREAITIEDIAKMSDKVSKSLGKASKGAKALGNSYSDVNDKITEMTRSQKINARQDTEWRIQTEKGRIIMAKIEALAVKRANAQKKNKDLTIKEVEALDNMNKELDEVNATIKIINKNFKNTGKMNFGPLEKGLDHTSHVLNSMAQGGAGGLASGLGDVTKSLVGMIPGWGQAANAAIGAVQAFWEAGLAADQFVKDANKAFVQLRGPDIMTTDMKKQFAEFNKQIYDLGANLRAGINVKQIHEFMGAAQQQGVSVVRLAGAMGDYRKSIDMAAKASANLGISISEVGSYTGELVNQFRMQMDDIDSAFTEIAFDAKKAGISTQSFWTAIDSASASLAIYGMKIGKTSNLLRDYMKNMVGGAKDAEKAVSDMMSLFAPGTAIEVQAPIAQFAQKGGHDFGADIVKAIDSLGNDITGFDKALQNAQGSYDKAVAAGDEDAKQRAKDAMTEIQAKKNQAILNQKMLKQYGDQYSKDKNAVNLAPALNLIVAQLGPKGIINDALKGITQSMGTKVGQPVETLADLMNVNQTVLEKIAETLKIPVGLLEQMRRDAAASAMDMKRAADSLDKVETKGIPGLGKLAGEKDEEKRVGIMKSALKDLGGMVGDPALADKLANVMLMGSEASNQLVKAFESGDKKKIQAALTSVALQKDIENNSKDFLHPAEANQKQAKKAFKMQLKETLSLREIQEIVGDSASYSMYSLGALQGIQTTAMNILTHLLGKDKKSDTQLKAEKKLGEIVSGMGKAFEGYAQKDEKGNITGIKSGGKIELARQVAGLSSLEDQLAASKTADEKNGGIESARTKSLNASILKLYEVQKQLVESGDAELVSAQQLLKDSESSDKDVKANALAELKTTYANTPGGDLAKVGLKRNAAGEFSKLDAEKYETAQKKAKTRATMETIGNAMSPTLLLTNVIWDWLRGKPSSVLKNAEVATGASDADVPTEATLNAPEIVTSKGMVTLDPGESILPREMSKFRSIPALGDFGPTGNATGGGKTINVVFNANGLTPRDFAEKVKNEIRAAMYTV